MLLVFTLLQIIAIAALFKYFWSRRKFYYLSFKVNRLWGYPFIGCVLKVRRQEDILKFIDDTRSKFYPRDGFVWFGPFPIFYASEPQVVKRILTSTACLKKIEFYDMFTKHFGAGIISTNPPTWNHHRKLIDPAFNIKILRTFMSIFNDEANILMDRLSTHVGHDAFNILPIFQACTMDITCQTTMGEKMNFQLNKNLELVRAFQNLSQATVVRIFNPFYHADLIFNLTKWGKMMKEAQNYLRKFVKELIERKLQQNEIDFDNSAIFIDRVIAFLKSNDFTLDDAISESIDIILGGYDTTANTCSYTIMCLAMFPEYQERVYEELLSVFPDKDNFYAEESDLQKLQYLDMVINENMRLMSPIPLAGRTADSEFVMQEYGIVFPKGTQILIDIFHMHRDENTWGPKSKTFFPDHFLPENTKDRHPFAFIPFTKGTRTCIGSRYAGLSLKLILGKVLRKYKFTTKFKFEDLHFVENIMLKLKDTPLLEIHEREF